MKSNHTPTPPLPNRTMLVVWAWNEGADTHDGEIWSVAGSRQGLDHLLCLDQRESPASLTALANYVHHHLVEGEVFVFLHRRHGYRQESVQKLLQLAPTLSNGRQARFFLFGEGGDTLYLTRDPRGLLGSSGAFSARLPYGPAREMVVSAIADPSARLLKAEHFNYIWQCYQYAFKARIFELREDLLSGLGSLLPLTTLPAGHIYTHLRQDTYRVLLLRLLSFTGRLQPHTKPDQELANQAKTLGRAFHFDDSGPQIASALGETTSQHYQLLSDYIKQDILATGQPVDLVVLRRLFDDLLASIPGATYHG